VTLYTYDGLGRRSIETNPDNSFKQWCFNGQVTVGQTNCRSHLLSDGHDWTDAADENGSDWQQTTDAFGRLTSVFEPNGTSPTPSMETDYGYDPLGNLWSVVQRGVSGGSARVRSFSYDGFSRLLCASNPENSSASCLTNGSRAYVTGTTGYTYDADGNVWTKLSPAVNQSSGTQTIGYCYDSLNRLTYKFYSGTFSCTNPSGYAQSFAYDSSAVTGSQYVVGHLTDEKSYNGATLVSERQLFAYDKMGRLLGENQFTPCNISSGTPFSLAYRYDLAGHVVASTDGATPIQGANTQFPCTAASLPASTYLNLVTCYDSAGRPTSITSNWAMYPTNLFSSGASPADPGGYSPAGQLLHWMQGPIVSNAAALTVTQTYDNRLRLNGITASGQVP